MENYEKFKLNEDAQKKLEKHGFKHIFDEEKQRYSIISTKTNKNGEIDHIFNYGNDDIRFSEYMTCALNDHIDNFIASVKIMNNLENNDNYKDYNIGLKADFDDFQVQLKNKQCLMVVEPKTVVDENVDLTIRTYSTTSKDFDTNAIFSDIEDFSEFSEYNKIETDYDLDVEDYPNYYHRTGVRTYLKPNNKQLVNIYDESYCRHAINFTDLEKTDFLAKPIELFKEKSIVEKYNDILENPKEQDIVNMLIEAKVIDSEKYNKLREEKKEQDFVNAVNSVNNKEQDNGLER